MNRNQLSTVLCSMAIVLAGNSAVLADSVDGIQVLKISPQDARAVIKTTDGKTQVIKQGDGLDAKTFSVQNSQFAGKEKQEKNSAVLTVIEIAEGRVVLEEGQGDDKETIIIRLKDGKQTVERIRKTPPSKPRQQMKAVSSQPSATGKSKGQRSSMY